MSILFHHYKELKECTSEVEEIEKARVTSSNKNMGLTKKEEVPTATLDSYFISNNNKIAEG